MERKFRILEEKPHYRGFFRLSQFTLQHTLFRGGWSLPLDRELFHRGSCVAVLPYDPNTDQVVLIEQFRVGALFTKEHPWLIEIVAGAIEEGEHPDEVAHRETWEEAGCHITQLIRIGEFFTTPGACSERITLFCGLIDATGLDGIQGLTEEQEDIRVFTVSFEEAMAKVTSGTVDSVVPALALYWLALHRTAIRNHQ